MQQPPGYIPICTTVANCLHGCEQTATVNLNHFTEFRPGYSEYCPCHGGWQSDKGTYAAGSSPSLYLVTQNTAPVTVTE